MFSSKVTSFVYSGSYDDLLLTSIVYEACAAVKFVLFFVNMNSPMSSGEKFCRDARLVLAVGNFALRCFVNPAKNLLLMKFV